MVEHAAMGAELAPEEEKSALEYLLGAPARTVHDVPVDYELPDGSMSKVTFVVLKTDLKLIDKIEQRNLDGTGRLDRITADTEIVGECCKALRDATGREIELASEEFLTVARPGAPEGDTLKHASKANALEERFRDQLGLMTVVAAEIRRLSGADSGRVGNVKRRLVEASLG